MRRIDRALQSVDSRHKQESYIGPLASTSAGGHNANVNNLYNSQVRNAKTVMPYGISSRPAGSVKAQTIVNDNSDSVVVGVYDPNRPQVGAGEVCLYSSGKCSIYLSSTGIISIVSGNSNIDIDKNAIDISRGKAQIQIKADDVTVKSGDTSIKINSTGGIVIDTEKTIEVKSTGDISVETEGKAGIIATGDISIETDGKIGLKSAGDMNVDCSNFIINGENIDDKINNAVNSIG